MTPRTGEEQWDCDGQRCHCHDFLLCSDCGCLHGFEIEAQSIDAYLASDEAVAELTAVLAPDFGPSYFPGLHDVTIFGKTPEGVATDILAALRLGRFGL